MSTCWSVLWAQRLCIILGNERLGEQRRSVSAETNIAHIISYNFGQEFRTKRLMGLGDGS